MKTPTRNHKCLVMILVLVLIAFGSRGVGYGQESADATLSGLTVSPVDIAGFSSDVTEYHLGVANSVTQVTITATATDAGATIQIGKSVTDRNTVASGSGQVVSLDEGPNRVVVWVTSYGGDTRNAYTITVGRGGDSSYGWKAADDFNTLRAAGNRRANGIWSDGTTMWVADEQDDKLYAYNLLTKARDAEKDFNTLAAAGNEHPEGIWSDGTTMWVADWSHRKLFAYNMATKARDASRDIDRESTGGGNLHPKGIWSDGTIMWVAYSFGAAGFGELLAHNIEANVRNASYDFNTLAAAGNEHPSGIWSDGNTMWVADDQKLYAYRLYTKRRITGRRVFSGSRIAALDFDTLKGAYTNIVPTGIWSDGTTMWVADANGKIFSFNMPPSSDATLSGLTVSPVGITGFGGEVATYHVGVANDVAQVTVTPTAKKPGATIDIDGTGVSSGSGHTVSLSEGENETTITVTAPDGQTTETYTLHVGRGSNSAFGWKAAADFNGLIAAGNTFPIGIWSDGTTMWAVDEHQDKIYAYDLATMMRDAAKDFETLKAAGNTNAWGIWSDGTTMWVVDADDTKIYAYDLETKSRDASKDFHTLDSAGNDYPIGIWSDGTTAWVSDWHDDKLYAYDLVAKNRVATKDIDNVGSGNIYPYGLWSDGETIWVAEERDDVLRAFNLRTKARQTAKDFDTLTSAGNTNITGIWSDGETMWVANRGRGVGKIFSYNMPASSDARLSGLGISPVEITDFSPGTLSYHIGVANEITQVTVTPSLSDERATMEIDGSSVPSGSGHTVSLAEGGNVITITVTAEDGTTTKVYTVTVGRGSNAPFGWKVTEDFNDLGLVSGVSPRGIWSDGTTMWVACATGNANIGANLCGYNMSTKERGPTFHTLGTWGNNSPMGIVSDGTTMWVADANDKKIYAYRLSTYARDSSKDINLLSSGITSPAGMSVEPVFAGLWVADHSDDHIYAYNRYQLKRIPRVDFNTLSAAGNTQPWGIWTDGTTMWVADTGDAKLYAYKRDSKARDPAKDFNTLNAAGNTQPWGIWSDGTTMWVVDSGKKRIFSYNMPDFTDATLSGLTVIPENITGFSPDVTAYHVGVANDVTQLWVMPTPNLSGGTIDLDGSSVVSGSAYSVSLSEGRNDVTITVTADDGQTTKVYTVTVGRSDTTVYGWNAAEDFNTLNAAENDYPTGLWSDGTTIWVSDLVDDKLYAYNRSTRDRDPGKDFDTLEQAGNVSPRGVWSDGEAMWVADPDDDRIWAYNIITKSHDRSKDFNTLSAAGNQYPAGIWSDGTTMWVLDTQDDKIYAYDMATKVRDAAKDFNTLSTLSGGNRTLSGIWSDGTTMWVVVDRAVHGTLDDKIHAYDLATKARDEMKDFTRLTAAGNEEPSGVWSDGTTLWVANYELRSFNNAGDRIRHYSSKIYAYNMPSSGGTTTAATDFNGDGKTDFVDFFLFADAYGGTDARFDLDGNGTVDFADFFKFVDAFGT